MRQQQLNLCQRGLSLVLAGLMASPTLVGPAALASSLSAEDMVLTDAILGSGLDIEIFTLDTGRLHADTINVIEAIRKRYGYAVRV